LIDIGNNVESEAFLEIQHQQTVAGAMRES